MVEKEKNRFNKLQQEQRDLDESYQQSKRNKEERKDYSNPVAAAVRTPKFKSKVINNKKLPILEKLVTIPIVIKIIVKIISIPGIAYGR